MLMIRIIGGTIVGYAVTAILVMVSFTLMWMVIGAQAAFVAGTTDTSLAWTLPALLIGIVAAIVGGSVAARIGGARAVYALAGLLLVFGLLSAVFQARGGAEEAAEALAGRDPAQLSAFEAASVAVGPAWFNWMVPFTGLAGALLGGRLVGHRESEPG